MVINFIKNYSILILIITMNILWIMIHLVFLWRWDFLSAMGPIIWSIFLAYYLDFYINKLLKENNTEEEKWL